MESTRRAISTAAERGLPNFRQCLDTAPNNPDLILLDQLAEI
jgi:hypothetical protein